MNIKNLILFLLLLPLVAVSGCGQEAKVTFQVTDEFGKPLRGATVGIGTYRATAGTGITGGVFDDTKAATDSNGIASVRHGTKMPEIRYGVMPLTGYYQGPGGRSFYFTNHTATRWEPWNPTVQIVLRPILNPIPMYARQLVRFIPQPTNTYGLDLEVGDWVAPDGKGQVADMLFKVTGHTAEINDNDARLTVSFANSKDGIQPFLPMTNSAFISPRTAPLDGYEPALQFRRTRLPGQRSPQMIDDNEHPTNYVFRVRTVLDDQGNIKSALYGKIQGGIRFGGAVPHCNLTLKNYYLNPTPNDRNLEFDFHRNLATDVKPLDEVRDP